jgi:hypothetical protein
MADVINHLRNARPTRRTKSTHKIPGVTHYDATYGYDICQTEPEKNFRDVEWGKRINASDGIKHVRRQESRVASIESTIKERRQYRSEARGAKRLTNNEICMTHHSKRKRHKSVTKIDRKTLVTTYFV